MSRRQIILRKWSSRIHASDRQAYVDHVLATEAGDYAKTAGNLGYHALTRDLGDGTTQITTLSWWESMEAIRRFAGGEPEIACYYPGDDRFLLERPERVEYHIVEAGSVTISAD